MQYLLVIFISLSLLSVNVNAAKGGRWQSDGSGSDSTSGPGKSKKKWKQSADTNPDTVAPVLALPSDKQVSATSSNGAVVEFSVSASDEVDGSVPVQCSPQSGQVFPLGASTVHCSTQDNAGNVQSGSFLVSVIDDQPPSIIAPPTIAQSSPNGEPVEIVFAAHGVSAIDEVDSSIDFSCLPSSGSLFAVGTTQVACTAIDSAQNTATDAFTVVIDNATPPPVENAAPQVVFSAPAANTILQAGETLAVLLNASDIDGSIQYCKLYQNGSLIRQESSAPYEWGSHVDDATLQNLVEGVYNYTASCTDNGNLESSASLTVLVEAAPEPVLANVLLDWIVPSTREDGSLLPASEIDSYEIYYYVAGNSQAGTSLSIASQDVAGNLVTNQQISALNTGDYYFSIATVDVEGNVSEFVAPVNLVIP